MIGSLEQGMRKYRRRPTPPRWPLYPPRTAPTARALERYLVNLAADQEQQLQVMDSEAQRCRALLTAPSQPPPRKR